MKTRFILLSVLLLTASSIFSQQKKEIRALRITEKIKIDGQLDEPAFQKSMPATNFTIYKPYNGEKARFRSEVHVLYDDDAIYIGAMMYDPSPDSISREFGLRDADGLNADFFQISIDPYRQGQLGFAFKVYASGVEADNKINLNEEDPNWDAVWKNAVNINKEGWVAELRIPYSALRFPVDSVQNWGVNFWREIRRYRETMTWNYIDDSQNDWLYQSGTLTGLNNIKPSLRLSLMPYASIGLEKPASSNDWKTTYNAGMDLKYGINESFTLDMTLVPDFSQVESDDEVFNFSPFEIRYDEKRQFFTEGTELFNRCGLFYSRRIGDRPKYADDVYDSLNANEVVEKNPSTTQLINATKISGRTKGGLGIGVFNAMTATSSATVVDTLSGDARKVTTQPFTNYNILVFDQALRQNSYISLINTNVYMPGTDYAANVTGAESRYTFWNNSVAFLGQFNVSQKYRKHLQPDYGIKYFWEFQRIKGNFRFIFGETLETETYDPNDLGFLYNNNEFSHFAAFSYNIYKATGIILESSNMLYMDHQMLYAPRNYVSSDIGVNSRTTFVNHLTAGFDFKIYPTEINDYFEARSPGQVFKQPAYWESSIWLSPDYRKAFVLDGGAEYAQASDYEQRITEFWLKPRYRFSDRLSVDIRGEYEHSKNNLGYVSTQQSGDQSAIIFGRRNVTEIENTLRAQFFLSNKAAFNLKIRHYLVEAEYQEFYTLQQDGYLKEYPESDDYPNQDFSFNLFNADIFFTWYFAPGSEMSISWKTAINHYDSKVVNDYFRSLKYTLESPAANSVSLKLIYYIDYQDVKSLFRRKDV